LQKFRVRGGDKVMTIGYHATGNTVGTNSGALLDVLTAQNTEGRQIIFHQPSSTVINQRWDFVPAEDIYAFLGVKQSSWLTKYKAALIAYDSYWATRYNSVYSYLFNPSDFSTSLDLAFFLRSQIDIDRTPALIAMTKSVMKAINFSTMPAAQRFVFPRYYYPFRQVVYKPYC